MAKTLAIRAGLVGILTVLSFAPFFRSFEMFRSALRMRAWHFLTPREAMLPFQTALESVAGRHWGWIPVFVRMAPILIALPFAAAVLFHRMRPRGMEPSRSHGGAVDPTAGWGRRLGIPSDDPEGALVLASLAILMAILLSGLGHVWPWFVLWPIPLAVMIPGHWIARGWLALALAIPFGFGFVIHGSGLPDLLRFQLSTTACYLFAAAIFALVPIRWFPPTTAGTFPDGTG
ncbi:MAG: hypothetical protein R3E12_08710 [Candidatus Eisenbacteria bacterium]